MSKRLLVLSLLLSFSFIVPAKEYSGRDLITGIKTPEHEMSVSAISSGDVYLVWSLKHLLGEPLISGRGVVILPDRSHYSVTYHNQRYKVPAEVFKKIKPITVKVKANISPTLFVDFDLGAMNDIYFGSSTLFANQSNIEQRLSFNIPGSPAWNDLFYTNNLGLSSGYLTTDQAKVLFDKGLAIVPLSSYSEAVFDLNPIKHWIKRQSDVGNPITPVYTSDKRVFDQSEGDADPFKKFEQEDQPASVAMLEEIDADIKRFIIQRCGPFYTSVSVSREFSLTAEYIGESKAEMRARERKQAAAAKKREQEIRSAKKEAMRELPEMQSRWKERREAIRAETRAYVIKTYGLEQSMERLNKLLDENFTSVEGFGRTYYISI